MGILFDSVIIIDHFNGIDLATSYIHDFHQHGYVSAITRAEVLAGFDISRGTIATQFLDAFNQIDINGEIADTATRLRREKRWKLPDAIQAAAALVSGIALATRNTKDFNPRKDTFVVVPYTL